MWQERLYPELKLLEPEARERVMAQANRRVLRGWRLWLVALAILAAFLALPQMFRLTNDLAPFVRSIARWTFPIAALLVFFFGVYFLWHASFRDHIRSAIIARGIPICRRCGYNLTGLNEPRCPECGTPFEPRDDAR